MNKTPPAQVRTMSLEGGFDWTGVQIRRESYAARESIFEQGDPCEAVLYIEVGTVRLSVVSSAGKEAVVALLEPGHFLGEGCLAGQKTRIGTATAMSPCQLVIVETEEMRRQIHAQPALAGRFLAHMLTRNARVEQDLIDQLFNSSEKRLARALLLLAHYGEDHRPVQEIPKVSQEILAEMVGTTRSRVNFFMNKFRKLGLIEYNGTLKVHNSLLSVVLHDGPIAMPPAPATTTSAIAPNADEPNVPRPRVAAGGRPLRQPHAIRAAGARIRNQGGAE